LEATYLHDGRAILSFDLEAEAYTLLTPLATAKQNIIKAEAEIQKRENDRSNNRLNRGVGMT